MSCAADLVVVGGGPAGSAAAIWAALGGLRVMLFERAHFPRPHPGETLHPGAGAILRQLGVEDRVAAASGMRHAGIAVTWANETVHARFAAARAGQSRARGYQILRERLDVIMLERAREVGVEVVQPSPPLVPILSEGRVVGTSGRLGAHLARVVIDATGSAAWLSRQLGLTWTQASPPLRAYYGYLEGEIPGAPRDPSMIGDRDGWTWTAEVSPGLFQWTRLWFRPPPRPERPQTLAMLRPRGPVRCADVTWRSAPAAGPGYFLTGDAASVLDPASSHGVLRALMSGMMASHIVRCSRAGALSDDEAATNFRRWMSDWFYHDVQRMTTLYSRLGWSPQPVYPATAKGG